jgi:hypothetical protein
VTAFDDFRSEFVIRGSPFRHVDFVIDGVSTQWLQHTAHGRGATGSVTMLSGLVLETATLRTGAYPRRYGDRLGPELDLTVREGSRRGSSMRGVIGGSQAVLVAEGPMGGSGPTGSARGSWLVSVRQSYLEWPPESSESGRTAFGFSDGVGKLSFDVRPTQQLGLTVVGGISSVDDEDNLAPNQLADGSNHASVFNVFWRSTLGSASVIKQQASVVTQRFRNTEQSGRETDRGANRAIAYRASLSRPLAGGLLDAGAQVERTTAAQVPRVPDTAVVAGMAWLRSGFAHFAWAPVPSLTLSPGFRVTSSSIARKPAVSRWILAEWSFRPGWNTIGSVGASRQLPGPDHLRRDAALLELRPERAANFELGIEHQPTDAVRWQATAFHRKESDVFRSVETHPRLVGGILRFPASERYPNALRGTSRGIELLVSRRSLHGLSGWTAYSYGRTQQTDTTRKETYWADFDQRHTFNLLGTYRFSERTSIGATFRAGSNSPVPGYLAYKDGRLVVAEVRNQVRLSPYARLDLRADRQFHYFGRRMTLFVEVVNALNHANVGLADGVVDPLTGAASGFTDRLLRRRVSAGVVIEFGAP